MTLPQHITNDRTRGMPHEGSNYVCWCVESVDVLQQEVSDLREQIGQLRQLLWARGPYCAQHGERNPCSQHRWIGEPDEE